MRFMEGGGVARGEALASCRVCLSSCPSRLECFFNDFDPNRAYRPDDLGESTQDYHAFLNEGMTCLDAATRRLGCRRMRAMNNLHIDQLDAIIVLLRRSGILLDNFGFGVVTSAYVDDQGRDIPASVRIIAEGNRDMPMIWLHNNRAFGDNLGETAYDHWEGMTQGGSIEITNAWGLRTPWVGLI